MSRKDIAREEREWERAFALRRSLAPYVQIGFQTRGAVSDFCREYKCSRSSAFRYLAKARLDDRASVLRRSKPGRKTMSTGLSDEHERIIQQVLRKHFLTRNKVSISSALSAVNVELTGQGLFTISKSTLVRRIATIPDRKITLKRDGSTAARQDFQIIRGRNIVKDALSVVQIDHSLLNVMVVRPDTRECIGRPYLTVLIDLATSMPTGIFVSMNAPSALNLMMAFQRSVFPKAEYLASLGIRRDWPAHGLPLTISSDNGTDLTSKAFNRGLELYGVHHYYRPIAQPQLGGNVERVIGTIQRFVETLPGTTFSSVGAKGTYKPEKQAKLTLLDVERLLLNFILNHYVHDKKRRLHTTPMNAWNTSWRDRKSLPRLPQDPARFRLDFLPFEHRKIQREGLEIFGMFYRGEQLQKMKNCGVQSVTVKFDPTDIRTVHFSADDKSYFDAKSEHFPRNPLSLDDWRELTRSREERLNRNLSAPDPAIAHDFRKQIFDEADRLRQAAKSDQYTQPPHGKPQDIRNLGGSSEFLPEGRW